jgi:hypothetical protein
VSPLETLLQIITEFNVKQFFVLQLPNNNAWCNTGSACKSVDRSFIKVLIGDKL